jgi:hypothetical protein
MNKGGKKRSKLNRKCVAETNENKQVYSLGNVYGDLKKKQKKQDALFF